MRKILFTGGSGFMGLNILPLLKEKYNIFAPNRKELNLLDKEKVRNYLEEYLFDAVVHCANPNSVKNAVDDRQETMFEDSLRMFMNFYDAKDLYDKLIYTGSGAEYDKTIDTVSVREEECFRSMPENSYGLAKYIMNQITHTSDNVYNICVFGCYGPYDHYSKFITHCIDCCQQNRAITIKQDCRFDYIHVYDLGRMMEWMIDNTMKHQMYNASGGHHILLSQMAAEVKKQMKSSMRIEIFSEDFNLEYTADGSRFWNESGLHPQISMEEGIKRQIEWQIKGS
ncbi:NAD-dependent epimerase/dehydratase family protein [Thermodesulfobacteriota bacterium]